MWVCSGSVPGSQSFTLQHLFHVELIHPTGAPAPGIRRDVAQPGRALAWGARGRQFKSARPDQYLLPDSKPLSHILELIHCSSHSMARETPALCRVCADGIETKTRGVAGASGMARMYRATGDTEMK